MPSNKPNWMDEEENRAEKIAEIGGTSNPKAPQLIKVNREPARKQKAFYIQENFSEMFEDLAYLEKKKNGVKAPQLAEEALLMLFKKYKLDISKL